jgi:2-polyprenyl-6-methoxyphenol hydroxylase-like FAD-dependent oxidoreductase
MALGSDGDPLQSHRWAQSMVGTEYGKIKYWGGSPENAKNVSLASPSRYLDLPQTLLEPLLVKYAALHGFPVRFSTQLTSVHRDEETGKIICGIEDLATTATYEIHTKYIFGADGGRSTVARSFGFTFNRQPSQGVAVNIVFNADLGSIMRERHAQLHWIMRPDTKVKFGMSPVIRMVRPWTEWMLIVVNPSEAVAEKMSPHNTELIDYIKELIGVQTIDIEILRINGWVVRETVAEQFSNGSNVHILGDAAHRHPPAHGLGSNTSIQDAYNLAWKTAYVAKGHAGPGLLDSFSQERQPVGAKLVREANQCYREHLAVWRALGMLADTPEEGARQINELYEDNEAGNARREELYHALQEKTREGEAMGLANNDFYVSNAVYLDDETEPRPEIVGDHVTTMQISTYPGSRLPHAWLDLATREKEISTHDLAGHGHFTVFYGRGGLAWGQAARSIAKQTGIPIKAYGIGFGLDYHDVYRRWHEIRGVEEDGVLVVRPDRFVAWRAKKMVPDATEKLSYVLDKVLSRDGLSYASLQ